MSSDPVPLFTGCPAGQPWDGPEGGSSVIRRLTLPDGVDYHVKVPCGTPADAEVWYGPANEMLADHLLAVLGVTGRPRAALIQFAPDAFTEFEGQTTRNSPHAHPGSRVAYGREVLDAPTRWVESPTPGRIRDVVAQDIVLRWMGAEGDHALHDKGFLDADGVPVAIDFGGVNLCRSWQAPGDHDEPLRALPYGGLLPWIRLLHRETQIVGDLADALRVLDEDRVRDAVQATPAEWATDDAKERVIAELRRRQPIISGWYHRWGRGISAT